MWHSPEGVARTDAEAKGTGEVKPETLSELSGDGCDGHASRVCAGGRVGYAGRWMLKLGASAARRMSEGASDGNKQHQILRETRLLENRSSLLPPHASSRL